MAWAEGALWVAHYRERKIHKIDPATGKILRTIASDRYVTGVTWTNGGLWHGTWKTTKASCAASRPKPARCRRACSCPGRLRLRAGSGRRRVLCGGSTSGRIRAVRQPEPASESR